MTQATQRGRWYVCTDYELMIDFWERMKDNCTYIYIGEEICPSTKRVHWQIFYGLKNASTEKAQIKKLNKRHVEIMEGSIKSNAKYCSKEGKKIMEHGKLPAEGERTDIQGLVECIKSGCTKRDIFEKYPEYALKYGKSLDQYLMMYENKRTWEMDVKIYWGKPGVGKTRKVYDTYGFENVYVKPVGKWWDGYQGEDVIIIDDLDPENTHDIQFNFYLQLLDRYPMKLEVKGGYTQMRSKTIVFTSNFNPEFWFQHKPNRAAFFRRVKSIEECL